MCDANSNQCQKVVKTATFKCEEGKKNQSLFPMLLATTREFPFWFAIPRKIWRGSVRLKCKITIKTVPLLPQYQFLYFFFLLLFPLWQDAFLFIFHKSMKEKGRRKRNLARFKASICNIDSNVGMGNFWCYGMLCWAQEMFQAI